MKIQTFCWCFCVIVLSLTNIHQSNSISKLRSDMESELRIVRHWNQCIESVLQRHKDNHAEIVTAINEGRRLVRKDEQ